MSPLLADVAKLQMTSRAAILLASMSCGSKAMTREVLRCNDGNWCSKCWTLRIVSWLFASHLIDLSRVPPLYILERSSTSPIISGLLSPVCSNFSTLASSNVDLGSTLYP